VLEGRQDAGAAAGERLLLVLEDALGRRRCLRLRVGGRGLLGDVGLAPLRITVALVLFRRRAGLVGLSFHCAHGVRRECEVLQRRSCQEFEQLEKKVGPTSVAGANPSTVSTPALAQHFTRASAPSDQPLAMPYSPSIRPMSTAAPII
jgi:hypothetical protein